VDIGFAIRTTLDMKELLWEQEAHRLNITVVDRADCYIAVGPLSPLWSRESVRFEELSSSL